MSGVTYWFRVMAVLALVALVALPADLLAADGSPRRASHAARPSELSLRVTADGRLSADLRDVSLSTILKAIAREAGTKITVPSALSYPVTASFDDVPVDEALRILLRRESYILVYGGPRGPLELREVWVLTSAPAGASVAVPSRDALLPLTHTPEASARQLELVDLGHRPEREALEALGERLLDPDREVRRMAAGALAHSPRPEATSMLATVLTSDPDPEVRQVAAAAAARRGGPAAVHALRRARDDDAVPYVRALARLFLDRLGHQ